MIEKPFSAPAERNQVPILEQLRKHLSTESHQKLLEVGSGTGQHASYFAPEFPYLIWTTSDLKENHSGIEKWIQDSGCTNILGPLEIDLSSAVTSREQYDALYSANVIHIISWDKCLRLFDLAANCLRSGGDLFFYGPFKYENKFTSESNEQFESWLKERNSESGIRDFEVVKKELLTRGFELESDNSMPANNQFLHFQKI